MPTLSPIAATYRKAFVPMFFRELDGSSYYLIRYTDRAGFEHEAHIADRETAILIAHALGSDDDLVHSAALDLVARLDYSLDHE